MKTLRIITALLFVAVIAVPLVFFNFTPDAVSVIDNRKLTENPFTLDGDLTTNLQNYVNDRIGLRDEAITAYTILNDKLFGKMVHPSYTYGKNGYVFGAGLTTENDFGDFHIAFADMVAKIQTYCEQRNVPFLFVFNPAKPAIYTEEIAVGVNYNREWVDQFFAALDARGVQYLDNTQTLKALKENDIDSFNQKYDANHWNDLGAFYGTQAILQRLQAMSDTVRVNGMEEFNVGETLQESLLVSKFPINESVPSFSLNVSIDNLTENYTGKLNLHPSYQSFGYYVNNADYAKDTPRALVFQGSYMNSYGYKYMQNAFREYIHVHDYQNVIDFDYYFNIFQPECVVFEVAEYTFSDLYFEYEEMCEARYNPALSTVGKENCICIDVQNANVSVSKEDTLTTITWNTDQTYSSVWMELDTTYDMQKVENGYEVTVQTASYEASKGNMEIYAYS